MSTENACSKSCMNLYTARSSIILGLRPPDFLIPKENLQQIRNESTWESVNERRKSFKCVPNSSTVLCRMLWNSRVSLCKALPRKSNKASYIWGGAREAKAGKDKQILPGHRNGYATGTRWPIPRRTWRNSVDCSKDCKHATLHEVQTQSRFFPASLKYTFNQIEKTISGHCKACSIHILLRWRREDWRGKGAYRLHEQILSQAKVAWFISLGYSNQKQTQCGHKHYTATRIMPSYRRNTKVWTHRRHSGMYGHICVARIEEREIGSHRRYIEKVEHRSGLRETMDA